MTLPAEAAAVAQASRFSQVCNVWAPTYRQRTSVSLNKGLGSDPAADRISYDSLLAGWEDYLAHDNDGRPVVFIGQSQGAANLIKLLRSQVDDDATLRGRMVAALILGGNVQVPVGRTVGGTFANIPACTATGQTGCVIAYSSFRPHPRPTRSSGARVRGSACNRTNGPARANRCSARTRPRWPRRRRPWGAPTPYFISSGGAGAHWVTYPGLYTGTCESKGGATWLQIDAQAGGSRPVVQPTLGAEWGLHADDVNLALGNLVDDVQAAEATYAARHPTS